MCQSNDVTLIVTVGRDGSPRAVCDALCMWQWGALCDVLWQTLRRSEVALILTLTGAYADCWFNLSCVVCIVSCIGTIVFLHWRITVDPGWHRSPCARRVLSTFRLSVGLALAPCIYHALLCKWIATSWKQATSYGFICSLYCSLILLMAL